jgi:hypothetical protein
MVKYRYMIGGVEVPEEEYRRITAKAERKLKRGGYRPKRREKKASEHCSVMDAHDERYRKWYKEPPPPVIEDYRHPQAAKEWPGYRRVLTPQGWKEGPARFTSKAEQSKYENLYGFVQHTGKPREERRR